MEACKEGLELAFARSNLLIVDSDRAQLLAAVSAKERDRSHLLHLVSEMKRLLGDQGGIVSFVKVDRMQHCVSHNLANFARAEESTLFRIRPVVAVRSGR